MKKGHSDCRGGADSSKYKVKMFASFLCSIKLIDREKQDDVRENWMIEQFVCILKQKPQASRS